MAVLTGDYQYIGRSSAVSCSAGWNYYILLYAKTSGNISTGKHTVTVLMRLACTSDSSFYGYRTDGSVTVAGTNAIAWSNAQKPAAAWGGALTVGGVYYYHYVDLGEGSVEVNTGWGAAKAGASTQRAPSSRILRVKRRRGRHWLWSGACFGDRSS